MAYHLAHDSSIIHDPVLLSGIIKLQGGNEHEMTWQEKAKLKIYLLQGQDDINPVAKMLQRAIAV